MKKWIFTFVFILFILTAAVPQNIPNRGFEQWETRQLFEQPRSWLTSDIMGAFNGDTALSVRKTDDAYSGSYALYLENRVYDQEKTPGFAFCQGRVSGDYPDLKYLGGFPYTGQPDSLVGYFKYHVESGDTARILVIFKKDGNALSENWFTLTGEQLSYKRMAFPFNPVSGVPDTALVGISAGTPWDPVTGSYLYVDHLQFDQDAQSIPNGDFENWDMLTYEDPVGWESGNWVSVLTQSDKMCFQTEDAHSGSYAMKLKTVYLDFAEQNIGIASVGKLEVENISGGFPYDETPRAISGYYKYMPVGVDSAQVVVFCTHWNDQTDSRDQTIRVFNLPPVPEYTYFNEPLNLGDMTVDTVNIICLSGQAFGGGGSNAPGSVLYLDDLWLESKCSYADTTSLFAFHDTTICLNDTLVLDPGSGYSGYLWSDSSMAQTLPVGDSGTYWVTVVDTGGCTLTDSVVVHVDACTKVEPVMKQIADFRIYPNPFNETFTLELPSDLTGIINISVTNILGQQLEEKEMYAGTASRLRIDMNSQPKGLYFVRIRTGEKEKIFKIIKY